MSASFSNLSSVSESTMLDESEHSQLSPEPAEPGKKRSEGAHRSDASSNLSKPEPESLPTGLQNKSKKAITSDNKFSVTVDASTNTMKLAGNSNLRMFGTNNPDSILALAKQVQGVVRGAAGERDSQNFKCALDTINGIGPKDELEGLLAVQMIGVHSLAVECLARASLKGQTPEGMDANINHATKLL